MLRTAIAALILATTGCRAVPDPLPGFPRLVLWAWERPDDLRFINPSVTGIAFLARSIEWHDGRVILHPRLQPLRFPSKVSLMAVVRLESDGSSLPDSASIASSIAAVSGLPGVTAVQVDFDARLSERRWYAGLLRDTRAALAPGVRLGITALASWCEGDPWIRGLPIDDAVPMLFRMGAHEQWSGRDFSIPICRSSVGVSTDELPKTVPAGRRIFVFHPAPWTPDAYREVKRIARQWR